MLKRLHLHIFLAVAVCLAVTDCESTSPVATTLGPDLAIQPEPRGLVNELPEASPEEVVEWAVRCDDLMPDDCLSLAYILRFGNTETDRNEGLAAHVYELECNRAELTACRELAEMHQVGSAPDADIDEAIRLFEMACDGELIDACLALAVLYRTHEARQDLDSARLLLSNACDSGHPGSCLNLALMNLNGEGCQPNPSLAAEAFSELCEAGNGPACEELSDLVAVGNGVEVNVTEAWRLIRRACDLGHRRACNRRGVGPANRR